MGVGSGEGVRDATADRGVDVLPVLESPLANRGGRPVSQMAGDVSDEPVALGVLHDLANQMPGPGWEKSSSAGR